jgi:ribosomal-protein-serine acetyltransferase
MRPIMIDMPMPIITPRLLMRPPVMGFTDCYFYIDAVRESLDEFSRWLPWAQFIPSVESTEDYIRECCANWIIKTNNNVGLPLFIFDRESNQFAGLIVMHNIAWDVPRFEFGYWLRNSFTKKGLASEAVNAMARYCFTELRAKRIEIRCELGNVKSKKIPERLGFKFDGCLHCNQLAVATGAITDTLLYSRVDLNGLPPLDVRWG